MLSETLFCLREGDLILPNQVNLQYQKYNLCQRLQNDPRHTTASPDPHRPWIEEQAACPYCTHLDDQHTPKVPVPSSPRLQPIHHLAKHLLRPFITLEALHLQLAHRTIRALHLRLSQRTLEVVHYNSKCQLQVQKVRTLALLLVCQRVA
jgi:hypothetical protein